MLSLNWTTDRPSECGDYWLRLPSYERKRDYERMMSVGVRDDGYNLAVFQDGRWIGALGRQSDDDWLTNAMWAVRKPSDPTGQKYVILDTRQILQNCAMFWRPDGAGYTCDLNEAGSYDGSVQHRDTDILVPIEVARSMAVTHVCVEPLKRAGFWPKPPVIKRKPQRCERCPRFVKRGGWLCPKCFKKETGKSS